MANRLNNEDMDGWLSANEVVGAAVEVVHAARAEADTKIAEATDAEASFQESIVQAIDAHAKARKLNEAVQARLAAGESSSLDDLTSRESAEEAARAAALDVVTKSEISAVLFKVAAKAAASRADAEVAYIRAVSASEVALDGIVDDYLKGSQ